MLILEENFKWHLEAFASKAFDLLDQIFHNEKECTTTTT